MTLAPTFGNLGYGEMILVLGAALFAFARVQRAPVLQRRESRGISLLSLDLVASSLFGFVLSVATVRWSGGLAPLTAVAASVVASGGLVYSAIADLAPPRRAMLLRAVIALVAWSVGVQLL